jgi:hypothetical protein
MKNTKFIALYLLLFTLAAPAAHAISWRGIFIAGDDSIENFDAGREDLTALFSRQGNMVSTVQLSSSDKYIGSRGILEANKDNLFNAFVNLGVKSGEGCFVHMTSHGTRDRGFYLSRAGILPPKSLSALVNKACGDNPTVVLISACFSGQFITEDLKGPNRVILTAARPDRPSFGCSADTKYTFWDQCLLDEVPRSRDWQEVYSNVQNCITQKEMKLGAKPSGPQAFFGANTASWTVMH